MTTPRGIEERKMCEDIIKEWDKRFAVGEVYTILAKEIIKKYPHKFRRQKPSFMMGKMMLAQARFYLKL